MRTFRLNAPIIIGAGALVVFGIRARPSSPQGRRRVERNGVRPPRASSLASASSRRRSTAATGHAAMAGAPACAVGARRRGDAGLAAAGARAGRPNQAGVGVPRRPGPRLPPCRLFARARRLISGRSKASPAASPTAPGRFGVDGGSHVSSQSGRGAASGRSPRGEQGRSQRAGRRRSVFTPLRSREAHTFSADADRSGADCACSPPFASAAGSGTSLARADWPQEPSAE